MSRGDGSDPFMKRRVLFRLFPFNLFTFPLLLNLWEREGIDELFRIEIITNEEELSGVGPEDTLLYSFMTPHLPLIFPEIERVRSTGALLVAGGPHVTGDIDFGFRLGFHTLFTGPGEESFPLFGRELAEAPSLKVFHGKVYRGDPSSTLWTERWPFSKRFKQIPPLEIMRGCHWKCLYCQSGQKKSSFRPPEGIVPYLEETLKRGYNRLSFLSPSALEYGSLRPGVPDLETLEAFLALASSKKKILYREYGIFPSEIRPETLRPETARLLRRYATNRKLTVGVQSGSSTLLSAIHRGHGLSVAQEAAESANNEGFRLNLDFIVGLPDEGTQEREETFAFFQTLHKKHRVWIQPHFFFPLSGSPYEKRFPSFFSPAERERLLSLRKEGYVADWWIEDERKVLSFFGWLKRTFPDRFSLYRGAPPPIR